MNAEQTKAAIRLAMRSYETMLLNPKHWDPETEVFRCSQRISEAEVLRLAGIKSRSTLFAKHHSGIKKELSAFIERLKVQTDKRRLKEKKPVEVPKASRLEQFAQTIAAQEYKIRALEHELETLRSKGDSGVTNITKQRG